MHTQGKCPGGSLRRDLESGRHTCRREPWIKKVDAAEVCGQSNVTTHGISRTYEELWEHEGGRKGGQEF